MSSHQPVMVEAILDGLQVRGKANAVYIDGTVGAGGHSLAILQNRPDNQVIGFDRDLAALAIAQEQLIDYSARVRLIHGSYLDIPQHVVEKVDGILLDLGLSSMQLDNPERGFAFRFDGPLDMRFDSTSDDPTAADLVNEWSAEELADLLYSYGEEQYSRKIARAIVQNRPIHSTLALANLIESLHLPKQKIHPATRTFQALRIAVNKELESVKAVLPLAVNYLISGGRLAVITFHSLEDRIVKNFFKLEASNCICPPRHPVCTCGHQATLMSITRKPLIANEQEVLTNPRSRSAKLRVVERL